LLDNQPAEPTKLKTENSNPVPQRAKNQDHPKSGGETQPTERESRIEDDDENMADELEAFLRGLPSP